MIHIELQNNS